MNSNKQVACEQSFVVAKQKRNCTEQFLRETSKEIYSRLLFNNRYCFPSHSQSLPFRNHARPYHDQYLSFSNQACPDHDQSLSFGNQGRPYHDQASQKGSRQSFNRVHFLCAAQKVVSRQLTAAATGFSLCSVLF